MQYHIYRDEEKLATETYFSVASRECKKLGGNKIVDMRGIHEFNLIDGVWNIKRLAPLGRIPKKEVVKEHNLTTEELIFP